MGEEIYTPADHIARQVKVTAAAKKGRPRCCLDSYSINAKSGDKI
jgi:hypothetical protein